jgi:hypothetical protein
MKRLFTLLLIACSTIATIHAQQRAKGQQTTPIHVKTLFNDIIMTWGNPSDEVYSINKNPNTNLIESSVRITYFVANNSDWTDGNDKSLNLKDISEAFKKDEPTSYQLLHLSPGNNESFSLRAVDGNGKDKSYLVRASNKEEMWLLCTKNAENPQLRDAYAIKWSLSNDKSKILGGIYQITSLRPDIYEKDMASSKKTFKIVGRVDENIKDSLYNIYIAESAEELANIGDDDYVACVPVINKRFEWQTELEKPMVGRLRCIFPDGELCSAWINLDFVPGETYNITVHNGYFDDDEDFENRVGRYSGKSLLNRKQIQGIDDVVGEDDDWEAVDTVAVYDEGYVSPALGKEVFVPTPEQQMRLEALSTALKGNLEAVKATYTSLAPFVKLGSLTGSDNYFKQIIKLNKELDVKFQNFIKFLNSVEGAPSDWKEIYGEILKFYSEQSQAYGELYKNVGVLPKSAKNAQKHVNQLMEKYMKEMGNAMK